MVQYEPGYAIFPTFHQLSEESTELMSELQYSSSCVSYSLPSSDSDLFIRKDTGPI